MPDGIFVHAGKSRLDFGLNIVRRHVCIACRVGSLGERVFMQFWLAPVSRRLE